MTAWRKVTNILFCYMAGTALACSLIGQLQAQFWFADLLGQFQLQALAGGVLFLLIALLNRHKAGVILSLALMLSGLVAVTPVWLHERNAPAASGPIAKIISYNVLSYSEHQEVVANWIREQQPDVIALIEANYRWVDTVAGLKDLLPYSTMIDHPGNVGMHLLSRYPLENIVLYRDKTDYYPNIPTAHMWEIFPMIAADIALPIGRVHFIIAHPATPMQAEGRLMRNAQISIFGEMIAASHLPTVLMGDFNAVPWSQPFLGMLRSHSLFGNTIHPSWPSGLYDVGIPIDQIVASKGAVVSSITTGPVQYSDHRARMADLSIIK